MDDDNPTYTDYTGAKHWILRGSHPWELSDDNPHHRDNGPAIIFPDGTKVYYQYGNIHRLDGPAYEGSGNVNRWYYNDVLIVGCFSQEQFERYLKTISFR